MTFKKSVIAHAFGLPARYAYHKVRDEEELMDTRIHQRTKGLIIWVDIPFDLPAYQTPSDTQVIQSWQTETAELPAIPWDLAALPILPVMSMDPTSRIEKALIDTEIWHTPHPLLKTDHYTVLKFAGDLDQHLAMWSNWDDVHGSPYDANKSFMLEVSTYLANQGVVFILAPTPSNNFLRLWQHFLSIIVYDAAAVYAIGPRDFDWPVPVQWLAESVELAKDLIDKIWTHLSPP
jgi:hypothetical protein